jgi:tRNA(fMet)-specific endonuclease VapC
MSGKLILDTSAVLALFCGHRETNETLNQVETVCLPSVVVGELLFGARKCSRPFEEVNKINTIIQKTFPVHIDFLTAEFYADIIHQLETDGKRIPLNDIWIAALAMQYHCPLLAKDHHFTRIRGLELLSL